MKKNNYWRFILRNSRLPADLRPGDTYHLDDHEQEICHQLIKVFRAKTGDQIVLMNKNIADKSNNSAEFTVQSVSKKEIVLQLTGVNILTEPLKYNLTLALALPNKPAKLETILEHCTELGVSLFKIINTDNSNYPHQLRPDRLEKIILEAAEQSERAALPQFIFHKSLDEYLKLLDRPCYAALERMENCHSLLHWPINENCEVLVGPEGGWSEREIQLFGNPQIRPFSLGRSILRNETAAIVSCGLVGLMLQE